MDKVRFEALPKKRTGNKSQEIGSIPCSESKKHDE